MATIEPSELLEHATWLRKLARTLVSDGADDLVQETWVAALRRPPRRAESPRPWLRTVLTNAARLRWRGDAHRVAREQAVASGCEAPSSAQLLERHEQQARLAKLVGELDEPFRSTVLLRFTEDLTPTQIARHLGVPAGTVRWRLKEALDRLRAQLDDAHDGDRRAWIVALGPLARPRASRATPVALAAVAVAVVGVLTVAASGDPPMPAVVAPAARVSTATPSRLPSSVDWLAQRDAPHRTLTGRVVTAGTPVAGALVRLLADPLPPRDVTTGADGRFDFGQQSPRAYVLGASLPGKLAAIRRIDLRDPTAATDVELELEPCTASLYGTVSDASGTPIASAAVLREGAIGTESDEAGRYELCVLPSAALLAEVRIAVRAAGFGTHLLTLAPAGRVHHDIVLVPEATVTGRVVAVDGSPIAAAHVALDLVEAAPPEHGITLVAMADDDGRFAIGGLVEGAYRISATSRDASISVAVRVATGQNREVELRTAPVAVLRGRVVANGRPVAGVTVDVATDAAVSQADGTFVLERAPLGDIELATTPYRRVSGTVHVAVGDNVTEVVIDQLGTLRGTVRRHGVPVPFARVDIRGPSRTGVTSDASGRFEARGLAAGAYDLAADDRRMSAMFVSEEAVALGPGETREHDIELAWGGEIAGHVVDGRGDPVAGVAVRFQGRVAGTCITDPSGAFACGSLVGDTYRVAVFPIDGAASAFRFVTPPPKLELRDGDAHLEGVRLAIDPTVLAITGTVVDDTGSAVSDVTVRAFVGDRRPLGHLAMPTAVTDGNGRFRLADLSPGDYQVEVERGSSAARSKVAAGSSVTLTLDRSRCNGARGHEVPATLTRPPAPIRWGEHVELVGWSLPATAEADTSVELTLVFRTLRPLDRDWRIFSHFDSTVRINADHDPAIGWCPMTGWQTGEIVVDRSMVQLVKPGRYGLTIGFFGGKSPDWEHLEVTASPLAMANAPHHGVHVADIDVTSRTGTAAD